MSGASFQALLMANAGSVISVPVSLGTATGTASAISNSLTTSGTVPAGGTIFVVVMFAKSATGSVSTIADSNGNTYTLAVAGVWNATGNDCQELWYAPAPSGLPSGSTILVTLTGAANANAWPMGAAYSTGLTATPLDKTNVTKYEPGSGTIASGATATLTQAKELVIGAAGFYVTTTLTEGSGFTQINDLAAGGGNNLRSHLAYQIVNATTAVNYQPSSTASITGGVMIATFKGT